MEQIQSVKCLAKTLKTKTVLCITIILLLFGGVLIVVHTTYMYAKIVRQESTDRKVRQMSETDDGPVWSWLHGNKPVRPKSLCKKGVPDPGNIWAHSWQYATEDTDCDGRIILIFECQVCGKRKDRFSTESFM